MLYWISYTKSSRYPDGSKFPQLNAGVYVRKVKKPCVTKGKTTHLKKYVVIDRRWYVTCRGKQVVMQKCHTAKQKQITIIESKLYNHIVDPQAHCLEVYKCKLSDLHRYGRQDIVEKLEYPGIAAATQLAAAARKLKGDLATRVAALAERRDLLADKYSPEALRCFCRYNTFGTKPVKTRL